MQKKLGKITGVVLISVLALTFFGFNPVHAATEIYVDPRYPPGIVEHTWGPGTLFNITVRISDVADLFAWQVKLNYSPSILNATGAWLPRWDPEYVFYGKASVGPTPVLGEGYVLIADSLLSTPTFTGSGKLAIIEFEVMGWGSTFLDIDNADTYALNYDLEEVPLTKTNGYFENQAIQPATMYVDPPMISNPLLIPCNNFVVTIEIDNATGLNSFEFKIGFNASVLNAVDVVLGTFFPSGTTEKTIDNTNGFLVFNATLPVAEPPKDGAGTLAVVTFHVESVGISDLDLYDPPISKLADKDQQLLPQTASLDGFFKNLKGAKLYIDPAEIRDPLMKPPRIFSVDVVIDDAENLYGYEFKLGYNTKMLTAIGVEIHVVLGEGNFTNDWYVKDSIGEIWINVTYYSPAIPITTYTPESLATITFKVDNVGSSVLDLFDTELWDDTGTPIPYEVTDGFVMTEIHDVAITNVVPTPTFVYAGEMVQIDVTAKNKGNLTETFDVKAYYDSSLIGTQTVTDLPPDTETTLTFNWDTTGVTDGVFTMKGEAALVPYEFNPADNIYIDGTVEVQTRIRDLAVLSVTAEPSATYADPNWPVNITVVAKNKGMDPETFDVTVFWNDTNLIATQTVTDLPSDTEITLIFTWDTASLQVCNKYKISANATILEHEIDTTDNWLDDGYVKIKLMADINGDGKVDIRDLAILSQAFGSYPGHPRWNPEADLNKDLKVDIKDLAIGASNFGKTC